MFLPFCQPAAPSTDTRCPSHHPGFVIKWLDWPVDDPYSRMRTLELLAGRCVIFNCKEVEEEMTPRALGLAEMKQIPIFFVLHRM